MTPDDRPISALPRSRAGIAALGLVASLAALSSTGARATFTVEAPSVPSPAIAQAPSERPAAPTNLLPAVDYGRAWDETVTGFGHPQKVSVLLAQIAPQGAQWRFEPGVNGDKKTSWKGSMSRRDALKAALSQADQEAVEQDGGASIVVRALAGALPGGGRPTPVSGGTRDDPAPVPADESQAWIVSSGTTLKETLLQWCKESGWTLDFIATDRGPFMTSHPFSGAFEKASSDLISLYISGKEPIRAHFAGGSRVLTVWNLSDPNAPTF